MKTVLFDLYKSIVLDANPGGAFQGWFAEAGIKNAKPSEWFDDATQIEGHQYVAWCAGARAVLEAIGYDRKAGDPECVCNLVLIRCAAHPGNGES